MTEVLRQNAVQRISLPLSSHDADDLSRLRDDMAGGASSRPSQASMAHEAFRRGLDIMWAEQQEQAYVELREELHATAAARRERARSRRRGTAGPQ